ncbi:hypothetical protein RCC89_02935 [Cytophagaceae bacterium ABcell3]|nr:hypothetical protein RCC89_02935 [Cytophagaceae bacterium ABcell3]
MKTATLTTIKKELAGLPTEELQKILIRLARYKQENKELLSYLLFESGDEHAFIQSVSEQIEAELSKVNKSSLYLAKKTIRKVLKMTKKYIRYSGKKETEVELLIFFCKKLQETNLPFQDSKVLLNLYQRQVENIEKALAGLHEDLQYDYESEVDALKI